MATVTASEDTAQWGTRVTFHGEGWTPGSEVSIGPRYTVAREDGTFDMTVALSPTDDKGQPVVAPMTVTFTGEDGGETVSIVVSLTGSD